MPSVQPTFNEFLCGDCSLLLQEFPNDSVDLIATDPPYGLEFMGKDWDRAVPKVEVWKECLRVLKSGAFAFILCTPRQDCLNHMIVNLESAGFNVGFSSLYWCFASGFPKAENIALVVDKQECKKQLAEELGHKPTKEEFNEAWKSFRQVTGRSRTCIGPSMAKTRPSQIDVEGNNWETANIITVPTTDQAKVLDGSYGGFQPKPAVEVIIVAMKPVSERTYVDQALKNQKGITWLDGCRVPFQSQEDASTAFDNSTAHRAKDDWKTSKDTIYEGGHGVLKGQFQSEGRFPANLLVSDDALNDGEIKQTDAPTREPKTTGTRQGSLVGNFGIKEGGGGGQVYSDVGSFSRYFDLDAWFQERLKELPDSVQRTFPFLIVSKAGKTERDAGLEGMPERDSRKMRDKGRVEGMKFTGAGNPRAEIARNWHPTVKPLKLMSYLVTLGSREGDVVLDPFAGTGTTCIAAHILNRKWVGIEIEPEYVKIAQGRLEPYVTQQKLT